MLRLIGIGTVFALVAVSYALLLTKGALDTERLHHAATATERITGKRRLRYTGRTPRPRQKIPGAAWRGRRRRSGMRRNVTPSCGRPSPCQDYRRTSQGSGR